MPHTRIKILFTDALFAAKLRLNAAGLGVKSYKI